jgi:hypothetical protein
MKIYHPHAAVELTYIRQQGQHSIADAIADITAINSVSAIGQFISLLPRPLHSI